MTMIEWIYSLIKADVDFLSESDRIIHASEIQNVTVLQADYRVRLSLKDGSDEIISGDSFDKANSLIFADIMLSRPGLDVLEWFAKREKPWRKK